MTSDDNQIAREVEQEAADQIARLKCQAAHPSTAGTAPTIREVDLKRGYRQIQPRWNRKNDFPRMTIRPVPGVAEGETLWVATLWFDRGKPVLVNGRQVSRTRSSRDELLWWAQRTVEEFRSISRFWRSGQLGSDWLRWAPQW
ncbi:hypothetical protein [Glutamicibacter halophytocola]|uniref:Uncharacterized protein n=1 Tax=Glutamicibacter halophytocola TaxID=1933880 RepID=A0AA94XTF5_9MICC|nr:hypothetical protein [Glutamicibacter halophytocola]UUX60141.1 hypothetical protein NUH22_05895 [Glutamicibacter halophytocola]